MNLIVIKRNSGDEVTQKNQRSLLGRSIHKLINWYTCLRSKKRFDRELKNFIQYNPAFHLLAAEFDFHLTKKSCQVCRGNVILREIDMHVVNHSVYRQRIYEFLTNCTSELLNENVLKIFRFNEWRLPMIHYSDLNEHPLSNHFIYEDSKPPENDTVMGKLKIWGYDQNGYWELNRVCAPHEVSETVDRLVEGREGFEDYDYDPDRE